MQDLTENFYHIETTTRGFYSHMKWFDENNLCNSALPSQRVAFLIVNKKLIQT